MNITRIKHWVSNICIAKLLISFIFFLIYKKPNSNDHLMLAGESIITVICVTHFKENHTLEILTTSIGFLSCFPFSYLFVKIPTTFGIISFFSVLTMYIWFAVYMIIYVYNIINYEEEELKKD